MEEAAEMEEIDRSTRLLRELPRHRASAHFTAGVLRRLRDEPRRRGAPLRRLALGRLVLASGAAVVTAAAFLGAHGVIEDRGRERERSQAIHRLEALETRKAAIETEIRSLRRLARDAQPVVYLGSTPSVDVVVDLGRLAEARFASTPNEIRFASTPNERGYRR